MLLKYSFDILKFLNPLSMDTTKKWKKLDYHFKKNQWDLLQWIYQSSFHGNGMEFSEHTLYQDGESTKDIDWKLSAKTNQIYSKKYSEERDINILFIIDTPESMLFGSKDRTKKEVSEEIVYFLWSSALSNHDSIGALWCDWEEPTFFKPAKWRSHLYQLFHLWNDIPYQTSSHHLPEAFRFLKKMKIKHHILFVITDLLSWEDTSFLSDISLFNEIIILQILDPLELGNISWNFLLPIQANSHNFTMNLSNEWKRLSYQRCVTEQLLASKRQIHKYKAHQLFINTSQNTYKTLADFFQKSRLKSITS